MANKNDDVVVVNTNVLDAKSEELVNRTSTQQEDPKRVDGSEFYKHPEIVPVYTFLKDSLTGGGGFAGVSNQNNSNGTDISYYTYLPYGPAEEFYKNRIDKTIYYDDFEDFISALYKKIFSKDLFFDAKNNDTNTWLNDVNGYGWDIKKYTEMMCRNLCTYDFTINILEKEDDALYLINKNWEDLVEYSIEDKKFTSVVFKSTETEATQAMEYLNKNDQAFVKYNTNKGNERVFTKYFIQETGDSAKALVIKKRNKYTTIEGSLVDFGIDELPIQLQNYTVPEKPEDLFNERPRQFKIAKSRWYIWMRDSIKDRLLDAQGFDTHVYPQGTKGNKALGAVELPRNSTVTPITLSPDAEKPRVHMENVAQADQKYKALVEKFGVIVYTETSSDESGYAKSFRYEAKNETLNHTVQKIREFLDWLQEIKAKYNNDATTTNTEIMDNMARDYMPETPMVVDDILKLIDLAKAEKMDLFYKEILKIMVNKFGKGIIESNRKLILDEIENLNFSDNTE